MGLGPSRAMQEPRGISLKLVGERGPRRPGGDTCGLGPFVSEDLGSPAGRSKASCQPSRLFPKAPGSCWNLSQGKDFQQVLTGNVQPQNTITQSFREINKKAEICPQTHLAIVPGDKLSLQEASSPHSSSK